MKKKEKVPTFVDFFMNLINRFDCELDDGGVVYFRFKDLITWFLMKLKDEFLKGKKLNFKKKLDFFL